MRLAQARFAKGGKLTPWARARVPRPAVALGTGRDPVVPLISSGVAGPLELVHLPRMWLEALLEGTGRLAPGFSGRPLFDEIVCDTIALDGRALHAYLRTEPLGDYLACEAWVRDHARRLDHAAIVQVENAILKAHEGGTPLVLRDDVAAWDAVHALVTSAPGGTREPIVPAISSRTAGPLGVDHLPRVWLKNVLKRAGALPWGYRAGPVRVVAGGLAYVPEGLDKVTYDNIGLDMLESVAFIDAEQPAYPRFEAWVRERARRLDVASVTRHNAFRGDTRPPKAAAERAYAGWEVASDWAYLVDDLIDWRLIFDAVTGRAIPSWTGPVFP